LLLEEDCAMNRRIGVIVFTILTAIGVIGAVTLLWQGHGSMGTSHQFPWGIFISAYVFFALIGSGICLVSSLGSIFGIQPFPGIVKRSVVLAIITLIAAFLIMGLETPHPLHMIYMLLSPNLTAGIFWMGTLYGIYLIFLTGEFWHMIIKDNQKKAHLLGILAFATALAASSNLGAVFGFIHARPYWEGAYMPVYFVLTAFLSGSAALIILYYLKEGQASASPVIPALSKLMILFLAITAFFTVWKIITGLYGLVPSRVEAYKALLVGPYAFNFWALEVGAGMAAPLFLLVLKRTRTAAFTAAVLAITGIFFMRYDLVTIGQIVPLDVLDQAPLPVTYLRYSPTWVEWAVVALGFGFTGLAYLFAEERLDLDTSPSDQNGVSNIEKTIETIA
jgi:Ni/Fe-hydrogenase subunit HybB-like protein